MNWLAVSIGGAMGALLRYGINLALKDIAWLKIPLATTLCNLLGCFAIGIFSVVLVNEKWALQRLLLITGFCGGFTTFSAFAFEQKELLDNGLFSAQLIHLLLNNILGIIFVVLGYYLAKKWVYLS